MVDVSKLNDDLGFTKNIEVDNNGQLYLPGKQADYKIKITNKKLEITDLKKTNFATPQIYEKVKLVQFDDFKFFPYSALPFHFQDIIDVASPSNIPYQIDPKDLLRNDQDYHGFGLTVSQVYNAKGGSVSMNKAGMIEFTPQAKFTNIMHFDYQIKNSEGETNIRDVPVYLRTPDLPKESEFFDQWYLDYANVVPVWKDYTGKGVSVAVYDAGFLPIHNDIKDNLKWQTTAYHEFNGAKLEQHALMVASVIGAARNGEYIVGAAYGADLYSIQARMSSREQHIKSDFNFLKEFDVINNSWGAASVYMAQGSKESYENYADSLKDATRDGRDKLGSIVIFGSGNYKDQKHDANYDYLTNNQNIITIGGVEKPLDLAFTGKVKESFATPGEVVLVAAPDSNMLVLYADKQRHDQHGQFIFDHITKEADGTSFSAPLTSAIVALMLEANPKLGWRDVQQILSISAKKIAHKSTGWEINGAKNWNGVGMHFSHDYGFGKIDALGAVRLSETWPVQQISDQHYTKLSLPAGLLPIEQNQNLGGAYQHNININQNLNVEFVQVMIGGKPKPATDQQYPFNNIMPKFFANKNITLTSPSGTKSYLLTNDITVSDQHYRGDNEWEFGSVKFRNEPAYGNWTISIQEKEKSQGSAQTASEVLIKMQENMQFVIDALNIKIYGKAVETQFFLTDELWDAIDDSQKPIPEKELEFTALKKSCQDILTSCVVEKFEVVAFLMTDSEKTEIAGRCIKHKAQCEKLFSYKIQIRDEVTIFNAAALTFDFKLDLKAGEVELDGKKLQFNSVNKLTTIIAGSGDDIILGNDQDLTYYPNRGDDQIILGKGHNNIIYPVIGMNIGHDQIIAFDPFKDKLTFNSTNNTITLQNIKDHLNTNTTDWSINLVGVNIEQLGAEHLVINYN